MPVFKYIAYDASGRKKTGTIESEAKEKAVSVLKSRGIFSDTLEKIEKESSKSTGIFSNHFFRVSQKQRANLFFKLATLLESSIPLVEVLGIIASQEKGGLNDRLLDIKDKVSGGMKFSSALRTYPKIFGPVYLNMIEIAEKTGSLYKVLFTIANYEENKGALRYKLLSAIAYPAFILSLGVAVVSFLLIYIVPKMQHIFLSLHKSLPTVTKVIIAVGSFMKSYFLESFVFAVIGIVIFRFAYLRVEKFRNTIEKFLLGISAYRKLRIARFSSVLAFQLKAGIPLVDAVRSSYTVISNHLFCKRMEEAAENIEDGMAVDRAFERAGLFDRMFIASINTGQRSGKLSEFIGRMADYYEKDVDKLLKIVVSAAEPAAILFLGVVVGFIVMSIMVPLFDINQLIK
ncbi:MAG TPA: type II secretion system F family protein [Deltaproteobacteria bacterium]|nr:MAG: type II secretion system protein F [bacterium]HDH10373.1 type II secretion system F family protein [Deltaproteobacteria bacterium]